MSKPPRRISATYLENAALHYLERFSSSAENLRRVLLRKVQRAAQLHGDDPEIGAALVADLIARYRASGLLDDAAYAGAKSRSLHRRGTSSRAIRQTLSAKGVDAGTIETVVADLQEDADGNTELAAARNYVRRRRLGPWRLAETREAFREKDMAALGRAGFSWGIARRALEDGEE
ncbi:MAG TPA: regulatory protein RecX [Candidatus Sulfotelmatobacter sp.]|jgi:regulatory protein|nr:regulatory protein RecX [Candidatus Sulfotelmatobacter sp.]